MAYHRDRALRLLRQGAGSEDALFRDGQEEAIRHVVDGRGRLLVVQRTGWGKSFVYFIATKLLREAGGGPALLISPLLALMRNQIDAAKRMGVRAVTINSDNDDEWTAIEQSVIAGEVDILLISPERLANERFVTEVLARMASRVSLLVVDEAHCISDWGHDFRPHYRLIERIIRTLPPNLRVLATTATANDRVIRDLAPILGPNLLISRGDLNRPSLFLQNIRLPEQAQRLAWLADRLPRLPGHGIIYTLTVRDAELVARWLKTRAIAAEAYTSATPDRKALEDALSANRVKALVATTALSMGYDKPDLAFVIHYQTPGSAVAYYQQVGRAGRALAAAYGVLLRGDEDTEITRYFINTAFPTREEVAAVIDTLEKARAGLSLYELMGRLNLSMRRIENTIKLLALESPGPIVKIGAKWHLTASRLSSTFWERAERLTALRILEQQQMQEYAALESGHMEFLIRALDGPREGVVPPPLPPLPVTIEPATLNDALVFLRRLKHDIHPRDMWPAGGMPIYGLRGRIGAAFSAMPGKALCCWADSGWGDRVRNGKYRDGHFSDELVAACVEMIRRWKPRPEPRWVTCIPSPRHPDLVPDFARRVAGALGLPFQPVLANITSRPEQKSMANRIQQARNVDGAFRVVSAPPAEPVLVVDDMVDSGWTMTVAAWLLRSHGSGEVWPVALAKAGHGS